MKIGQTPELPSAAAQATGTVKQQARAGTSAASALGHGRFHPLLDEPVQAGEFRILRQGLVEVAEEARHVGQVLRLAVAVVQAGEDALANQLVLLISMVCILILLAVGRLARARDGR